MAALNFPNTPTVGQTYAASNGVTYTWDGKVWTAGVASGGGGGGGGAPSGPAGGDLAGSSYPNPVIAPLAVSSAKISDVTWGKVTGAPTSFPPNGAAGGDLTGSFPTPTIGAAKVVRAYGAADLWLSPVPGGGDVGKVLAVAAGPTLAWTAPPGGPPTGGAAGDLGGTYPSPTVLKARDGFQIAGAGSATSLTAATITSNGLLSALANDSFQWGAGSVKGHLIAGNATKRAEITVNMKDTAVQDDGAYSSWRMRLGCDTDDIKFQRHPVGGGAAVTFATLDANGTLTDVTAASGTPPILALGTGSSPVRFRIGSITGGNFQFYSNATLNNLKDDPALPSLAWVYDAPAREFGFYGAPAGASITWAQMLALNATGCTIPNGVLTVPGTTTGIDQLSVGFGPSNMGRLIALSSGANLTANGRFNGTVFTRDNATVAMWRLSLGVGGNAFFAYETPAGALSTPLNIDSAGNLTISGPGATKSTGTTWANPSDRRIKDEIADYLTGLDIVTQLQPRTFVYNGKGGSQAGMRGYGFIADEVATVMPEMVGTHAAKLDADDEELTDIQTVDQSNLILALVNAVQDLAARVVALEAA